VQYKLQSNNYLQEAKWSNEKHIPSLKEHADVTLMSTGLPFLFSLALMAAGQVVTKEALEWALGVPNMVRASGEIGRLLNDISSYKVIYVFLIPNIKEFFLSLLSKRVTHLSASELNRIIVYCNLCPSRQVCT
jgi:hypothetical protein